VVADKAEVWFQSRPSITFHDPLAAVALFHPEICRFRRGSVEVELVSPRAAGMMHWREEPDGPIAVATEVDANAFFERYFGVFEG
jgi:purine nucleosidase